MRALLLTCLLAGTAFAQPGPLGLFTHSDDVGGPPIKGATEFNPATGEYKVTGSGSDIWGKADQFHFLWREISGNFTVTATTQFLTEGNAHRKASIMLRKSLDADSPFVHLVIHGDGMPGVQFRSAKGGDVNTIDLPIEGPGTFQLKLVRSGANVVVSVAKDGGPLRERGTTQSQIGNPVLLGLAVASHTATAVNTNLFRDITIVQTPTPGRKQ